MACKNPDILTVMARDHALRPRNYGPLSGSQGHARLTGPCGDTMEFWLTTKGGKAKEVTFMTDGCSSSRACGSVTTCLAEGRSLSDVIALQPGAVLELLQGVPQEFEHCALLAVSTLKAACADCMGRQSDHHLESPDTLTAGNACHTSTPRKHESDAEVEPRAYAGCIPTIIHTEDKPMKIAIPVTNGKLSMHFGHCESFALVDVNPTEKKIVDREDVIAPPHEPGLLPPWLAERGANVIIAGGMGQRAQGLFAQQGIQVVIGAAAETPEQLATDFLAGTLQVGENICDH